MWIIIGIAFVALLLLIFIFRKFGDHDFPLIQFYTKGREAGFSLSEINLLRKVAMENRLEDPTSLFWSIRQLNRSIRGIILNFRSNEAWKSKDKAGFLSKLFELRRQVEFNLPKYSMGVSSSRSIKNHQRIKITCPGRGSYTAWVVENLRRYMATTYPEGSMLPKDFSWENQKVSVSFLRTDDAEYTFETKARQVVVKKDELFLHVNHSENLIRSQKRQSIRKQFSGPSTLCILKKLDGAEVKKQTLPELRCRMTDVSSGGAGVLIGGKGTVETPVRLQFKLKNTPIKLYGIVRGTTHNKKTNQSILNIQAISLSPRVKTSILLFVYDILDDQKDFPKPQENSSNQ